MAQSKFLRFLLFNWPVKVISLTFAIAVYVIIQYGTLDQKRIEIPLDIIHAHEYQITSIVPSSVTLIIRADERIIPLIDPSQIRATVDFSFVQSEGASSAPVILETGLIPLKGDISFTTEPEVIRAYFIRREQSSGEP